MKEEIQTAEAPDWESLTLANDFMFFKVMQEKALLKELIRRILPDIDIVEINLQAQKIVEIGPDIHGVRFDLFVRDQTGRAITIEMQVLNMRALPKRLRFYSSVGDTQLLEKGVLYSKLPDSYVIVICLFDYYGLGRHRYTFTSQCNEVAGLQMDDGITYIVLNALGTQDDINDKLRAFLDYIAGKPSEDPYILKLEDAVKRARMNKEWRRTYMTLYQRDLENQEIGVQKGLEEGRAEGRTEGRIEGQELLAGAIQELRIGRTADDLLASGYDQKTVELAMKCL